MFFLNSDFILTHVLVVGGIVGFSIFLMFLLEILFGLDRKD
jgi:hypothetical protein